MKKFKKTLALIMAIVLVALTMAMPVSAASKVDPSEGTMQQLEAYFYMFVDKLVFALGKALNRFIPGLDWGKTWQNYDDYQAPESFYSGEAEFDTAVYPDAEWSMGYSYGSLLEGLDILNGEFFMAGALQTTKGQVPTEILDDQGVNVYAISDGKSGIVVQAVIDGYGFSRGDVLKIRDMLSDFAKKNNIISINVSALHQHSGIDILGMGAPLVPAILANPALSFIGADLDMFIGGKNLKFMENLYPLHSFRGILCYGRREWGRRKIR